MSVTGAAKRRRRQHAIGFSHLARLCGTHVKGGRPVYAARSTLNVHEAIARERQAAARLASIKRKSKK